MEQHKWLEDLIWCPSQIYYNFVDPNTNTPYQLYLRWRWSDPWSAELYKCVDESFQEWTKEDKRFEIDEYYEDSEYKELESECIEKLRKLFPHINFVDP